MGTIEVRVDSVERQILEHCEVDGLVDKLAALPYAPCRPILTDRWMTLLARMEEHEAVGEMFVGFGLDRSDPVLCLLAVVDKPLPGNLDLSRPDRWYRSLFALLRDSRVSGRVPMYSQIVPSSLIREHSAERIIEVYCDRQCEILGSVKFRRV